LAPVPGELRLHPPLQAGHERLAVLLMKKQTRLRGKFGGAVVQNFALRRGNRFLAKYPLIPRELGFPFKIKRASAGFTRAVAII
jgi:hypothetical protein